MKQPPDTIWQAEQATMPKSGGNGRKAVGVALMIGILIGGIGTVGCFRGLPLFEPEMTLIISTLAPTSIPVFTSTPALTSTSTPTVTSTLTTTPMPTTTTSASALAMWVFAPSWGENPLGALDYESSRWEPVSCADGIGLNNLAVPYCNLTLIIKPRTDPCWGPDCVEEHRSLGPNAFRVFGATYEGKSVRQYYGVDLDGTFNLFQVDDVSTCIAEAESVLATLRPVSANVYQPTTLSAIESNCMPGWAAAQNPTTDIFHQYATCVDDSTLQMHFEPEAERIAVKGDFTAEKVLRLVYPDKEPQEGNGHWHVDTEAMGKGDTPIPGSTWVALVEDVVLGGVERKVVVMETSWCAGFKCDGDSVGFIFTRINEGWRLDIARRSIGGGVGNRWELAEIGPKRYGLLVHHTWGTQGHSMQSAAILALDCSFTTLFGEGLGESYIINLGEPEWGYTSEMEFVPGPNSEYYDIQVVTKGTKLEGTTVDETKIYTFSEGEYRLVDR